VTDYAVVRRKDRKNELHLMPECNPCKRRMNREQYKRYMRDDPSVRRRAWRKASRKRSGKNGAGRTHAELTLLRRVREQVLLRKQAGMTYTEMCKRMGWPESQTTRLTRALGITSYQKRGREYTTKGLSYETALLICKGAGIDPVDVGL
jgi:hypothetical protein